MPPPPPPIAAPVQHDQDAVHDRYKRLKLRYIELEQKFQTMCLDLQRAGEQNRRLVRERECVLLCNFSMSVCFPTLKSVVCSSTGFTKWLCHRRRLHRLPALYYQRPLVPYRVRIRRGMHHRGSEVRERLLSSNFWTKIRTTRSLRYPVDRPWIMIGGNLLSMPSMAWKTGTGPMPYLTETVIPTHLHRPDRYIPRHPIRSILQNRHQRHIIAIIHPVHRLLFHNFKHIATITIAVILILLQHNRTTSILTTNRPSHTQFMNPIIHLTFTLVHVQEPHRP